MPSIPTRRAVVRAGILSLAATVTIALVGVTPAVARGQVTFAPTGDDGWVRLAHLSPDTRAVDIEVAAERKGGASALQVKDVGYGVVSDYIQLPVGTYVISMTPSGAPAGTTSVIDASIDIVKDTSITVAAFGANKNLRTRVFQDDLTTPSAGDSRIRLIQASTVTDAVSVATASGLLIAKDATAGQSTSYASVPAGPWDLRLTAQGIRNSAPITLANGTVNTLFVLDNAQGGLTIKAVLDAASVGAAPIGGVQTGGGALAGPMAGLLDDVRG